VAIEDKPTAVSIMRELVERLQDIIEALKLAIVRNAKSDEYRKALKGTRRTPHHRQTNPGARRGKSIALFLKAPMNRLVGQGAMTVSRSD
jgi:hypothetical protein